LVLVSDFAPWFWNCHAGRFGPDAFKLYFQQTAIAHPELCRNLGDGVDQAAWLTGISMTSTPF
jgi:hypothetical protein